MKDFLKKYHKRKLTSNLFIVVAALIMAFAINFMLIDGTNFWKNLKTSVLDIKNNEKKADIFLQEINKKIHLKNSKNIENMTSFSISISYNPENIELKNIKSNLWEVSILWDKNDWIINIILNSNWKNLNINEDILEIDIEKKVEKQVWINLVNGNFTDKTGEKFELTSSGIVF